MAWHDRRGQDLTGQHRITADLRGQDMTGQDGTRQDSTGKERTGQDRTGQDRQDRTGCQLHYMTRHDVALHHVT